MSDTITITCDSCPHLKQNRDYAEYLLTVLHFESLRREPWEEDKFTEQDQVEFRPGMETCQPHSDKHARVCQQCVSCLKTHTQKKCLCTVNVLFLILQALDLLLNTGENAETLAAYKEAVLEVVRREATAAEKS